MRTLVCVALAALMATASAGSPQIVRSQAALPSWFEPNVGQTDSSVVFIGRGGGNTLLIERDGAISIAAETPIRMKLLGAQPASRTDGAELLQGRTNYFIGNDPSKWRTNIPQYTRVDLQEVYNGIDLVFRAASSIEYDFIVKPGGDPRAIRMQFDGAEDIRIAESGDLILRARGTEIVQRIPAVYQEFRGGRQRIRGGYVKRSRTEVSFDLGQYDPSRPLIIDPVLVSSIRFGGVDDWAEAIALDSAGNLFMCGMVHTAGTPKFGPGGGTADGFVAKLTATQTLVYITYIGGSGVDYLSSIALDGSGNAYVCGNSDSSDFPVVGDGQAAKAGATDAVVLKLDSTGSSLSYSNYMGGPGYDEAHDIVVNGLREVFLTGSAYDGFPSYNTCSGYDAWVAKLDFWGRSSWVYCLGGTGFDEANAIALDPVGDPVIVGTASSTNFPVSSNAMQKSSGGNSDIFFADLNSNGSIGYATYWGGIGNDHGRDLAIDAGGRFYLTGYTESPNFPAVGLSSSLAGSVDAFVLKFMLPNLVMYSGTMGGTADDYGLSIAVDDAGCAYIGGETLSGSTFPVKDPLMPAAGGADVFLMKLEPHGLTMYSTLIGGSSLDRWTLVLHQPSTTYTYVIGRTASSDFPLLPPPGGAPPSGMAIFIAKVDDGVKYSATPRVVATATASSVHVAWTAVPGASSYVVDRHNPASDVTTQVVGPAAWDDTSVVPGTAYLYRVKPVDVTGAPGYYSDDDLAVVFAATDDPAVASVTPIKAVHVQELRTAIDKARALKSLPPYAYTNSAAAGSIIRQSDFMEMQFAVNEARTALPLPRFRFTWSYVLNPTILAVHLNELRQSIR